jgi:phage tail sheath protein FI
VITSPSGGIAGLMARIDETRGVWKAAAGTEADIRGIVGVQYAFSDGQNGNLNPRGINTIRRFPTGIVNWGARTMDGDNDAGSEFKYVPVRRLLLFLEESIYRGLQWTVFEPNGLDLWAAIRLNVGNFLNGLFRQGAFAGATASQAYFVKCDAETTTPTDRALGIVNVHVGVATLKPAEFVVISFRQITLPEE